MIEIVNVLFKIWQKKTVFFVVFGGSGKLLLNTTGGITIDAIGSATRAEAAAILMRFCQSFANESGGR